MVGLARCTDELVKSSPVKFPVVWLKEGPVRSEGVLSLRRVQSNSSSLPCTKPHIETSKLHIVSKLPIFCKLNKTNKFSYQKFSLFFSWGQRSSPRHDTILESTITQADHELVKSGEA